MLSMQRRTLQLGIGTSDQYSPGTSLAVRSSPKDLNVPMMRMHRKLVFLTAELDYMGENDE